MASTNITSGRQSPVISELLLTAAQGNAGRYIADKLPITFRLANGSRFAGSLRLLPIAAAFGDARMIGTNELQRSSGAQYQDITKARSFVTTAFECVERAAKVLIDQQDIDRTADAAISGLTMRQSRVLQLYTTIMDALEYEVLAQVFSTGDYPDAAVGALTGGTTVAWDAAGSSPAQDGIACQDLIRSVSGAKPDYAVISYDVAQALRFHNETIGIKVTTSGAAPVARPLVKMADVLQMWADRWELEKGLFVANAMYNSANPASTAVLAEMSTAKVAFHCSAGLSNASQVAENVDVLGGPISLVLIQEQAMRGYEDPTTDPHGIQIAAKHAYKLLAPGDTAASRPAFVVTGVVT